MRRREGERRRTTSQPHRLQGGAGRKSELNAPAGGNGKGGMQGQEGKLGRKDKCVKYCWDGIKGGRRVSMVIHPEGLAVDCLKLRLEESSPDVETAGFGR